MKRIIKISGIIFLTVIVLFTMTVCTDSPPEEEVVNEDETPYNVVLLINHLGDTIKIENEQVWMPNYNTTKVSEAFLEFTADRDVAAMVVTDNSMFNIASGEIKKGLLTLNIPALSNEQMLDGENLFKKLFNEWENDIEVTQNVKGNVVTIASLIDKDEPPASENLREGIIREGFNGTEFSLTGEYLYYIYTDKNCKIKAGKIENKIVEYTFEAFEIDLKQGWNVVCKSETYTIEGYSSYKIESKNPSYKWLIQKMKN